MSCWTKEELENLLEDVVNELDLSDIAIEQHGPLGTAPATLVRLVLREKDLKIRILQAGITDLEQNVKLGQLEKEIIRLKAEKAELHKMVSDRDDEIVILKKGWTVDTSN
jgi:hypothetical protein